MLKELNSLELELKRLKLYKGSTLTLKGFSDPPKPLTA